MKSMKHLVPALVAGLVLLGSTSAWAAEGAPATPHAEKAKGDKASNESLTPEERAKRRKEAAERRSAQLKDLRAKKDAGTLTDAQKSTLERLEKQSERAKNGRRNRGPGEPGKGGKGRKDAADKPAA